MGDDDPLAYQFVHQPELMDDDCSVCAQLRATRGAEHLEMTRLVTFRRSGTSIHAFYESDTDDWEIELFPSDHPSIPRYVFPLSASTASTESFAQLQTWLKDCIEKHDRCHIVNSSEFLPTRLLKLQNIGTEKVFSLVLSHECPPETRYMTLSHCWGNAPAESKLRLLSDTYHSLRDAQSLNWLPKTFRDAFHVADTLNIRFLWIDRLCIFQDSKEDWSKESAMMQDVYRHSFLNISAHGAFDDEDGCFFDRNESQVKERFMNINLGSCQRPQPFVYRDQIPNYVSRMAEEGSIVSRGWILQERLLAPRVVHFGRKQLLWECNSSNSCESFPDNLSEFDWFRARFATNHTWKQLLESGSTNSYFRDLIGAPDQSFLVDWAVLVSDYSATLLTVPSDRLVAISGLANDMKKRFQEEKLQSQRPIEHSKQDSDIYLAGLWERSLPMGLLWCVDTLWPSPRPKYRAPSWSWASVGDPILFLNAFTSFRTTRLLASVDHAEVVPLRNETGEVLGGTLTVTSPIIVARLTSCEPTGSVDIQDIPSLRELRISDLSWRGEVSWDTTEQLEEVYCLLVAWEPTRVGNSVHSSVKGLALKQVGDQFSRVGKLWVDINQLDALEKIPRTTVKII
ncbi:heterokaryon incompatibility protein-domain-containing protein [Phyllosticta capitalensis]